MRVDPAKPEDWGCAHAHTHTHERIRKHTLGVTASAAALSPPPPFSFFSSSAAVAAVAAADMTTTMTTTHDDNDDSDYDDGNDNDDARYCHSYLTSTRSPSVLRSEHDAGEIGGWGANNTGGGWSAGLGTTGAGATSSLGGNRFYQTSASPSFDWRFAVPPSTNLTFDSIFRIPLQFPCLLQARLAVFVRRIC